MSRKLWEDDEAVSEYDLIAEDAQKAEELAEEYADAPTVVEADEDTLEEVAEESSFELNHSESNTIYNARLRLEQAKLYEMLINHNLFEGVDGVSSAAIKNVQNELKFYIVKRLEILLGLREPTTRTQSIASVDFPFNDIEIDFLKQLAHKGTFGKSDDGELVQLSPKVQAIKPVSSPAQKLKALTRKIEKKEEVVSKPLPEKPKKLETQQAPAKAVVKTPVARKVAPTKPKVRDSGMGRELTKEEAIEIAKADLKTSSGKPFHEMTAKEKAARIREANERHKRPQAIGAVPMPTADQLQMKYLTQQEKQSYSKNQTSQFNTMLASALAAKKNRGDMDDGE